MPGEFLDGSIEYNSNLTGIKNMSRSYRKVPSISWDDNNSGRRKSFRKPNMRHAAKAYRRKYGKLHHWGRKTVLWDWEYSSVEHFLEVLESHERMFKNTDGQIVSELCGHLQCILWEYYILWLKDRHTEDTPKNRRIHAEEQVRIHRHK